MVIVASKFGRMANRLLLFAHLAASAREHGYRVWNPAFDEYAQFFPSTESDFLCRFPPRRPRLRSARLRHAAYVLFARLAARPARLGGLLSVVHLPDEQELDVASPAFVRRARRRPVLVQGWQFRDYASLRRHGDEIREFFRPHQRYLDDASAAVATARGGADLLVGVHVRRGDYRTWDGGRHFWGLPQYADVMRRTAALFPGRRVSFLVCSDEPVEELGGARGPGHPVSDLYALAGCDYLFGPPSTYSMWASFWGRVPLRIVDEPAASFALESFAVFDHPR